MGRFLSPAKIAIVILIDLYYHRKAQPSDTIQVLSFISQHILRPADDTVVQVNGYQPLSLKDFEILLSPLKSDFPGRPLWHVYLKYLWSHTSLECLDDLFSRSRAGDDDSVTDCLPITPTSPLGQFLRKCRIEFLRLPFSDTQQLWEDFSLFRESSWPVWSSRNPEDAAHFLDAQGGYLGQISPVLVDRQDKRRTDGHESLPSQDALTQTIQYQLDVLQSSGCRLSADMQGSLADMVRYSAALPADLHFIRFFDAWRSGAYSDAIECLHRYFDYAVEGYGPSQNVKTYHQYALLHLAVLHADFGCYEEAIAAMNECIATARENQDTRCLNFGLSWLIYLRKAHPDYAFQERLAQGIAFAGSEPDILVFLQQKALENKDWTQLSSSLLSQADAAVHDSGNLTRAFELSCQAGYLNLTHSLKNLQTAQMRLHGALFSLMGSLPIAKCTVNIIDTVCADKATQPELLSMRCMQAYQMVTQGNFDLAMRCLREADPTRHRTLRLQNIHLGIANMVRFKRALLKNEMVIADRLLREIQMLRSVAEPDVVFETFCLEIEYLRMKDQVPKALEIIANLFDMVKGSPSSAQMHCIRLLIMKAELWAHVGVSAKGLSAVLRAANAAYRRNLMPLLWSAVAALAVILADAQEYTAARQVVDSILPQAIEGGDLALVARLYSELTNAYVGQACTEHAPGTKERDQLLNTALVYLERAMEAYRKVEDFNGTQSCLERKARLFRYRGDEGLAEEVDKMYEAEIKACMAREEQAAGTDVKSK